MKMKGASVSVAVSVLCILLAEFGRETAARPPYDWDRPERHTRTRPPLITVVPPVTSGAHIQISETGLNYAAGIAVDLLSTNIYEKQIPDEVGKSGKLEYWVTNLKIQSFNKPSSSIVVNPGSGLTWSLQDAGISVHGDWRYKYKLLFIPVRDSGSFDLTLDGASASVSVAIDKDVNGLPIIRFLSCSCSIANVQAKIHGSWLSWIYNIIFGIFKGKVKSSLQDAVCSAAEKTINTNAAQQLATLKTSVKLESRFFIDYQLVQNILFRDGYIQSAHKGEVFYVGDNTEAPFTPRPFTVVAPQRMLTAYISEYLVNTLGFVLQKYGILTYILTQNNVAEKDKGFFATTCDDICFGSLFPDVATNCPNSFVELNIVTTEAPTLLISSTSATGTIKGRIDVYVRRPDTTTATLLSVKVNCAIELTVGVRGNFIIASVTSIDPSITVLSSDIGDLPTDSLNQYITDALKYFIIPMLNEIGQKGFEIPNVDKVSFIGPTLTLIEGAVVVATDVQYTP